MKTNRLKTKYRILVVKDQSKYFQTALQNAVNLAKKIGGSIDLLYVKSPSLVVRDENQLAAWRELNKESGSAKKTMKEVVEIIAATEQIPITYSFTFGNLINEVDQHIKSTQPDIVVLGKRRTQVIDLIRKDLTLYLLKNYRGSLLISGDEQLFGSHNDISIGLLDDFLINNKSRLSEDLKKCTEKPITLLKINNSTNEQTEPTDVVKNKPVIPTDITTFEFDQGANLSNSVSKYIEKSGVSLLCVCKSNLLDLDKKLKNVTRQIQQTIQKTKAPVLVLQN